LSSDCGVENEGRIGFGDFHFVRRKRLRNNRRSLPADGLQGLIDGDVHAHGTSRHTSGGRRCETAELKSILHLFVGTVDEGGTHANSSTTAGFESRRQSLRLYSSFPKLRGRELLQPAGPSDPSSP